MGAQDVERVPTGPCCTGLVELRQRFGDHKEQGDRDVPELWAGIDGQRKRMDAFQLWMIASLATAVLSLIGITVTLLVVLAQRPAAPMKMSGQATVVSGESGDAAQAR